jgi:hypothetical protein
LEPVLDPLAGQSTIVGGVEDGLFAETKSASHLVACVPFAIVGARGGLHKDQVSSLDVKPTSWRANAFG